MYLGSQSKKLVKIGQLARCMLQLRQVVYPSLFCLEKHVLTKEGSKNNYYSKNHPKSYTIKKRKNKVKIRH